jgi:hypothetical protein
LDSAAVAQGIAVLPCPPFLALLLLAVFISIFILVLILFLIQTGSQQTGDAAGR